MLYKPSLPYNTPLLLLVPTKTTGYGSTKKVYPPIENGEIIYCSFKTYGGTEKVSNNTLVVEDTAIIETWFRPDITSDCRIVITGTKKVYDIIGEPENINMRNQYLKFKVTGVKGGV